MSYKNNLRPVFILITCFTSLACAQWLNYPAPGTPRLPNGKPNLAARAPRAANGKPDLSGVWHVEPTPLDELGRLYGDLVKNAEATGVPGNLSISKYAANILVDFRSDDTPLRSGVKLRPASGGNCLPAGIPFAFLLADPDKIVQAPGLIVIMYESDGTHRQIYTDGRPLPKDPQPSWLGYSTAKWEGDTLAVETAGFNDRTNLDLMGHPHSKALRVTERYHRRDFGHMDVLQFRGFLCALYGSQRRAQFLHFQRLEFRSLAFGFLLDLERSMASRGGKL